MKIITVGDKSFRLYIAELQIMQAILKIAEQINADYIDKCPLLIPVLKGSFMFASDLVKRLNADVKHLLLKHSHIKVISHRDSCHRSSVKRKM